jgi:hypothetical protein
MRTMVFACMERLSPDDVITEDSHTVAGWLEILLVTVVAWDFPNSFRED